MFKTKAFEVINKKTCFHFSAQILGFITEAAVFFICMAGFFLLYFSVFDKEYYIETLQRGLSAWLILGLVTLLLKKHKVIALVLNILCICGMVYINFDVLRESLIQIINFARTHASFHLDTEVYSVFLEIAFFVFAALLAFAQSLRLSFIPQLLFLGGTTAYLIILNKPYDTGIYILYVIIMLSAAAYCLSSKSSVFLGFVSFVLFGLAALFVTNSLSGYVSEDNYKERRSENEFLADLDNTSFVQQLYPDLTISALTEGQILSYTINGTITRQLLFIITLSNFENDFCLTSYRGDNYTGYGWSKLTDEQKKSLPENSPEKIENDIIEADYSGERLLFSYNTVEYSIEKNKTVTADFSPYFSLSGTAFHELQPEYLSLYDLTPEGVSSALYGEMSRNEAESLINREEKYREFVHENYLTVPEGIKEKLETVCGDLKNTQYTSQLLSDLKTRLNENLTFSITPEAVTEGADPIEFTLEQGEADSNRLASVGIMALRYLGYPARYAEGAAITADMKEMAVRVGDKYKIDIYNLDAAAYCEIYIDGFGWLPVNFLPDNAGELAEAQINTLNSRETTDLGELVKTTALPPVKAAAKYIIKAALVLLVLSAALLTARRYIIIFIRMLLINSGREETKKKALYVYTEKAKALFDENIFETSEVYGALNEYLYSRSPRSDPKEIYKQAKAAVKARLKTAGAFKKISAYLFKAI